ncbi:hypothetical protein RRG08_035563 [Elysia crispata]|uniref:Uncharacterized protein n=1 Tax=Elysia crispata TaxID=231223 RepID=A0AAE1B3F6_9GAST|nr:hypothetical protein RRG08_035563 [Elysia crispata]
MRKKEATQSSEYIDEDKRLVQMCENGRRHVEGRVTDESVEGGSRKPHYLPSAVRITKSRLVLLSAMCLKPLRNPLHIIILARAVQNTTPDTPVHCSVPERHEKNQQMVDDPSYLHDDN